ncbi:uncharacterized protein CCOS01_08853 [Colletotrichum costaricense]|uniref:Uncharacterized protein n=1 Tax=Colletotrichum costaricense TaxID=1209916 RepID=A0AAI9YTP4_9PEZI|nr:uncharacterized protein CCOS01_08853 [Colletotrichum costaricense]KAK1523766.1 hypothetical protein CCOS01_08853 [Colletotrichum costaricense]
MQWGPRMLNHGYTVHSLFNWAPVSVILESGYQKKNELPIVISPSGASGGIRASVCDTDASPHAPYPKSASGQTCSRLKDLTAESVCEATIRALLEPFLAARRANTPPLFQPQTSPHFIKTAIIKIAAAVWMDRLGIKAQSRLICPPLTTPAGRGAITK